MPETHTKDTILTCTVEPFIHEKSKEEIMTVYVTEGTTKIGWALKHPILGKLDEIMLCGPPNQIIGWALTHPAHSIAPP